MRPKCKLFLLILMSLFVGPADSYAADRASPRFSKSYEICSDKANAVDPAIRECNRKEFQLQDRELNRIYSELFKRLNKKSKLILQKSERAWIDYRDANCEFEGSSEAGGSLEFIIEGDCRIKQTIYRIEELKRRLEFVKEYPEGDE